MSAVTAGRCQEVTVERGGQIVGRLPYFVTHRGPFRLAVMPPFTHVLGPAVNAGVGKPQSRLVKRLSITRELIDQLPPLLHFEQYLDPGIDEGLAEADGLAFQSRGYSVAPQYTFEIDCRHSLEELWSAMHFKTRQHIRRAEEKYSVSTVQEPAFFVNEYLKNLAVLGRSNLIPFEYFPALFSACRSRACGEILGAFTPQGSAVSLVYLVWSPQTMYYTLSTRSFDPTDNGSVSLLIWSAMKRAHELGLKFDLDGVYTSGTARFLSGFGGRIKIRLAVKRSSGLLNFYRAMKMKPKQDHEFFT